MRIAHKRLPLLLLLSCLLSTAWSQVPTQVIVACAGSPDSANHVTVGTWDITSGNYTVFDSFPGARVQDVFIWGNDAYVCADSSLMRYDIDALQRRAEARVYGTNRTAVYNNKVIVTKGFGTKQGTSYFEVRHAGTLAPSYSLPQFLDHTYGIVIVGDTGYISNPGWYFNTTGKLGVVNLANQVFVRSMDMDTMGDLVRPLFLQGDYIYSMNIVKYNNPQWGFISAYHIPTATFTHTRLAMGLSIAAGVDEGLLFADLGGNVGTYDLALGQVSDAVLVPGRFAAMALDTVNNHLYLTRTDDATYGRIYKYSYGGALLDSVETGIGPRALAVDYNVTVGAADPTQAPPSLAVFPNPFGSHLEIDLRGFADPVSSLGLYDLQGRELRRLDAPGRALHRLHTADLPAGAYLLRAQSRSGTHQFHLVKLQD